MATWFEVARDAMNAVTDEEIASITPEGVCCKHEHVVGVATPELKKLCFLYVKYGKEETVARRKLMRAACESGQSELLEEVVKCSVQADAYKYAFWATVRQTFPLLSCKQYVGIREGWKVVWSEHDPEHDALSVVLDALVLGRGDYVTAHDKKGSSTH